MHWAALLFANQVDRNGRMYSEDVLIRMAEKYPHMAYNYKLKALEVLVDDKEISKESK